MNYKNIYNNLISKGQNRIIKGYKEKHHIIPKCMGGNDDADNLVFLTAEEHYLAHQLLIKIYPDNRKLIHAAGLMSASGKNLNRARNKQYGWIKRKLSEVRSEMMSGENHPNFGKPGYNTGNKYSDEIKAKISKAARGRILGPLSDETKKKISESNMGKHSKCKSDETKKRISEAQCGIPWSETRRSAQNKRDLDSKSLFKRISTSLLLDTDFTG